MVLYGRSCTTTCWAFFSPLHVWAVRTLSRDGQLPLPRSYATISIHCWWCCIFWPRDCVTARLSIFDRVHCIVLLIMVDYALISILNNGYRYCNDVWWLNFLFYLFSGFKKLASMITRFNIISSHTFWY